MYLEYHTNDHYLAEDAVYRVSRVSGTGSTGIAGMVGRATGRRPQICN